MTAPKEDPKSAALNWVDYADSIRRGTWQGEFIATRRPAVRADAAAAAAKAEQPATAAFAEQSHQGPLIASPALHKTLKP